MTSNIGAELIKGSVQPFGLSGRGKSTQEEQTYEKMKDTLMKEIERYFRPEFIDRLDDVIVFRSLSRANLVNIVELELNKVMQAPDRARAEDRPACPKPRSSSSRRAPTPTSAPARCAGPSSKTWKTRSARRSSAATSKART